MMIMGDEYISELARRIMIYDDHNEYLRICNA